MSEAQFGEPTGQLPLADDDQDLKARLPQSRVAKGTLRQIGEVAETVGLSLRTVRFYEEAGLVVPVQRTRGGFRLYDDESIERFRIIMQMKPLGFTIEEMRILIDVRAELGGPDVTPERRHQLRGRLDMFVDAAAAKVQALEEQLEVARGFASQLYTESSAMRNVG